MNDYTIEDIEQKVTSELIGNEIVFFEELNSTNEFLKKNCEKYKEGTVVVTKSQTAGKGRRGNKWENSNCESIFMSILLKPSKVVDVSILTLIAGLSVWKAISSPIVKIKWPNDIIINDKKVCGILAELVEDSEGIRNLIIGIGVNVNNTEFSDEIKDKATSLVLNGIEISIPALIEKICKEFESNYLKFNEKGFDFFIDEYKKLCITIGSEVKVITGTKEEVGKIIDINSDGTLKFEDKEKNIRNILSGEVRVRGINGYI